MNRDNITIGIFQTLLAYDPDVAEAIKNTKLVLKTLLPEQEEPEEVPF